MRVGMSLVGSSKGPYTEKGLSVTNQQNLVLKFLDSYLAQMKDFKGNACFSNASINSIDRRFANGKEHPVYCLKFSKVRNVRQTKYSLAKKGRYQAQGPISP
jgi:hypothetical protein